MNDPLKQLEELDGINGIKCLPLVVFADSNGNTSDGGDQVARTKLTRETTFQLTFPKAQRYSPFRCCPLVSFVGCL